MILTEIYKGVRIEQNPATGMFCGSFKKGSWYGWCTTAIQVKLKVDAVEAECEKYGMSWQQPDEPTPKYQVVMTSPDNRVWDSIKPTMAEAVNRIGEFMSLEDEPEIIRLGDMIVSCAGDHLRAIKIAKEHGFDVTFIEIESR